MTRVTMHFGDGSFKEPDMPSEDPEEACEEAKNWVSDNAWFETTDEQGDKNFELKL